MMHTKIVSRNSDEFILKYNSDLSGDCELTLGSNYFEISANSSTVIIPGMLIKEVADEVAKCASDDNNVPKHINIFRTLSELPYKVVCFSAAVHSYCEVLCALGLSFNHKHFMAKMTDRLTTLSSLCHQFDENLDTIPNTESDLEDLGIERIRLATNIISSTMVISSTIIELGSFDNSLSGHVLRYSRGVRKELLKQAKSIFKYVKDNENSDEGMLRILALYGIEQIDGDIFEDS